MALAVWVYMEKGESANYDIKNKELALLIKLSHSSLTKIRKKIYSSK
uniref:Uncharacterized protein n=1 Tax=uncultured Caudovirales phage TaxID=2100421 RepID=A0A6J7X2L1_9CAUD|nr:hypothetical protein UFOVP385_12 [uncultured Caudovirales phage]